jgi:NADPH2:quinone reductase
MKAIRIHEFGGPEVLKLEDIPTPKPGPGEVLVQVRAAGVNPFETYIRAGTYPVKPELPFTPGTDAGGIVAEAGPGAAGIDQGARVYTGGTITGSYAEFTVCKSTQVHSLPPSVSFSQGAAVNTPCVTAYRALFRRAQAQPGEGTCRHSRGLGGSLGERKLETGDRTRVAFGRGGTSPSAPDGARRPRKNRPDPVRLPVARPVSHRFHGGPALPSATVSTRA